MAEKNQEMSIDANPLNWLFVAAFAAIALVIVFGQGWVLQLMGIEKKGEVGDFINGISAPVINLLMAYLVYKSFYMQFEANRIQRDELKRLSIENENRKKSEWIGKIYEEARLELNSFVYRRYQSYQWVSYENLKGMQEMANDLKESPDQAGLTDPVPWAQLATLFTLVIWLKRENQKLDDNDEEKKRFGIIILLFVEKIRKFGGALYSGVDKKSAVGSNFIKAYELFYSESQI